MTCPIYIKKMNDTARLCAIDACVFIKWTQSKKGNSSRKISSRILQEYGSFTDIKMVPLGKINFMIFVYTFPTGWHKSIRLKTFLLKF